MPESSSSNADDAILSDARQLMAAEIAAAGGNEVFFFGSLSPAGAVNEVEVVARGSATAVPVFLQRAGGHRVLLHNHPSGDLTPSPADLSVASEAGTRGLGFFIVDNLVERVYRVVEPFAKQSRTPLDEDEIRSIFGADGTLARTLPRFEDRSGQRAMAVEVARAFNTDRVVALEAGTGVGKSYAYLVPAILWAVRNRSRVVVSTQTIALQEQLIEHDLPRLRRVLDVEFDYCLIKGRSNYACRRKAEEVRRQPDLLAQDSQQQNWIEEIYTHLQASKDGSLAEIPRLPPDAVWSHFASTSEQSLKTRCPHYQSCFYYEARRHAFRAHVVVVNHHLFFADLAVRRASGDFDANLVIPGYRQVIFDEAHRLEEIACQHLGAQFSRRGVLQQLGRLATPGRDGGSEKGRLPYVCSILYEARHATGLEHLDSEVLPLIREKRQRVGERFEELWTRVEQFREERCGTASGSSQSASQDDGALRIGSRPDDLPAAVIEGPLEWLRGDLKELERSLRRAHGILLDAPFEPRERFETASVELRAARRGVEAQIAALDRVLTDERGMVSWVEFPRGRGRNILLRVAPVRVADVLAESLYGPAASVVMTSATLSVGGRWEFLADRLGWALTEEGRFLGERFDSPFDFQSQSLLALPVDLPTPNESGYTVRLAEIVTDAATLARGRTFVLFTSHAMLRDVAARTGPRLEASGFPVLVQGRAPRGELLRRFRESGKAVLFGNQTFWEGVDVPGSALSCVIIARLPFRVPTHPLERGRAEEVMARGENAFRRLTVPQTALTLKQGFGRLIRTREDRGAVVIADPRIRARGYGAVLLRSLPDAERVEGAWDDVRGRLAAFFACERSAATERRE